MPDINNKPIVDSYGDTPDVFENDIEVYLDEFIKSHNIQDMTKETQGRWNAALLYIYKRVFKNNRDKLLNPDRISNAYNIDLVSAICDIYVNLCYAYDKEISIMGFYHLTGITQDTIYNWGNGDTRASSKASEIYKKLNKENEESLSGMLVSGKRPPIAVLGALNKRHGWNMGQPRGPEQLRPPVSREEITRRAEMAGELPGSVAELPD